MSNEQEHRQAGLGEEVQSTHNPVCGLGEADYCITCSDEALPARVVTVERQTGLALVEVLGARTEIDVTLIEAVTPGDWLLIHGGVAIARIEEEGDG